MALQLGFTHSTCLGRGEGGGEQSALGTGGLEGALLCTPQNKNPKPIVEAIYLCCRSLHQDLRPPKIISSQASYTLQ